MWPAESYTDPAVDRNSAKWKERRDQMASGEYFDVRYGCLVPKGVDNLLVAGRCISAEHEAQASLRIQQTCMSTGEAAGTLDTVMVKLSEKYQEDLESNIRRLSSALEPVMLIVMGILVGAIAMSIILPLFKLSRAMH